MYMYHHAITIYYKAGFTTLSLSLCRLCYKAVNLCDVR